MSIGYIFAISASSPHRDEVTTDLMLTNRKTDIFPLISSVILPNVLTLFNHVQPEILVTVY